MADDKIDSVLAELTREREALEADIETMIGDMAVAPDEARRTGEWSSTGAATQRYLELTERLAEVEQAMIDLTRQVVTAKASGTVH